MIGHIGLTPQSAAQLGGLKVQGSDAIAGRRLLEDALALEAAGAFAVILECVPREVARIIAGALGDEDLGALADRAEALCAKRPLYPGFRGYTAYA